MTNPINPLDALENKRWFKLICGASYQEVSVIRNLALVYCLAGADCIDVSADEAVLKAAQDGISQALALGAGSPPWLMVSFNDAQDPHFRKAWFDAAQCPSSCSRPCLTVCPTDAIAASVVQERCYGCGRCLSLCPYGLIEARGFTTEVAQLAPRLLPYVHAVEIHTQTGHQAQFQRLWQQLASYLDRLELVSISCPDPSPSDDRVLQYLRELYALMHPRPKRLMWQTDGRSMSGDIGKGTTYPTMRFAQKFLAAGLPGYVQLAGGTNHHTWSKLQQSDALRNRVHGIAYGSYARRLIDLSQAPFKLELQPLMLEQAIGQAQSLIRPMKQATAAAARTPLGDRATMPP